MSDQNFPKNAYRELVSVAHDLSTSDNPVERMLAVMALTLDPGEGISRTAESILEDLKQDKDPDVNQLANYIASITQLMPRK